ncbi:MAG: bifunctional UDP-N-acetylglucosamine diphosphorylase/glucosamine-1-phosphate N-acetyltransferase GlmU [Gammaproteobacteria bacterium]
MSIVILAAGQGTRMKSSRPKVLHQLAGKPLLQHVVDASRVLEPQQVIVVVGHGAAKVREIMQGQPLQFIEQAEQLGTGHAVQQCLDVIEPGNDVLVLVGDVPLIRGETLSALRAAMGDAAICVLSFLPDDPYGYGRLLRAENGDVIAIVEQKDTDAESVRIGECNSGIMIIRGDRLRDLLAGIGNNNAQGEYYLTDIVGLAADKGDRVTALACDEPGEVSGVNDQRQLASVERLYRASQASKLMQQGAKLYDPGRIDIRGSLQVGRDVEIDVNCVFEGEVVLGDNVRIGANCIIRDTRIGMDSEIKPMTSIEAAEIGRGVVIGPFARIRPGTKLADRVRIGNFVETKQSQIGEESKVNHLSYIGDTEIGTGVNIGAGTITCNYDGANKFRTVIEDGVFIGSDTQLVAPVRVEKNATVGAGSTITRDVPGEKLTISRAKQVTIEGWVRPRKKE